MRQSAYRWVAALGVMGMTLHMAPAFSGRALNIVAGTVSSVQARSIVVNGVTYDVQIQGGALHQLGQVHVGDRVQLVLSGPRGATQVSTIRVQHGH